MTLTNFFPVILAGGSGERFWPLSRKHRPKQFLTLDETGRSLLQATSDRLTQISGSPEQVMVVTGGEYRAHVLEQLPEMPLDNLIVEPVARDTAPAVLYAALRLAQEVPDAVMGVFPADHRITSPKEFDSVVRRAVEVGQTSDYLVTLGVTPTFPSTGYGYIRKGQLLVDGALPVFRAAQFTEKPDAELAREFLIDGNYSWNSGMFVWTVQSILNAFKKYQPQMYDALSLAMTRRRSTGEVKAVFPTLQKISIDYAILEKSDQVVVIPAEFGWDDLGDWNALERLLKGEGQNVSVGRHIGLDTDGAILYTTQGDDLIATIGLEDVVVVRTPEITLVVRKDRTQDIKKVVQQLKSHPELERFA
ncbi:mannose-1-phosphate guanylyltransferase [Deinococcus hopiensis]|uniref:mannose-1-phosphate guanylyltransferase n=1 Tax=Deinococcus hopiensis KR-140 TaxID=695939 RepID=A0A1W1VAC2_9DEIO|nr:mannose-1-phosphate guanylyltransferase [Deinococcus hopiensis]SMB90150.1 mannose-1-phosphate guanylyltransferase (GDP) /mannose-6-phosphate isomerase, type 2 [Deinococcus hopiensis KR-140]